MSGESFDAVDETLRISLESALSAAGARYRREERREPEHVVTYVVETRENRDLNLSLQLVADQLNVCFNGCAVLLEYAAHVPKFGRNPSALADWRSECLETVRAVLSSDLRISVRAWGKRVFG